VLGLLIGTDDGLLELIPGDAPQRRITGAITSIDYRGEFGMAGGPAAGAWLHTGKGWTRTAEGLTAPEAGQPAVRCVRVGGDGTLYIGLEPAGLLISRDKGASWTANDGIPALLKHERSVKTPPGASAPYLAGIVFPDDGVVAGISGAGAWGSRDRGTTWMRRSDGLDPLIRRMWDHPERGDRLYASTDSGFFRSDDGGFSWVQSLRGLDRSRFWDMAVIPATPDRIILSVSRAADGAEGALFRSINAGLSWERMALGKRDEFARAPLITRVWDSEDTLFALVDGAAWGSHDGGDSWMPLADGLPRAANVLVAAL
jgi:hypothetical protein